MNTLTFDEFASEVKIIRKNILPPFKISDVMDMKTTRGVYKGLSILKIILDLHLIFLKCTNICLINK